MNHRWLVWPWTRRFAPIRNWLAITVMDTTVSWRPLTLREQVHELVHSVQWATHGWRFPALYAQASLEAWQDGGDWYRANRFEVEAYAAEAAA